jgi:sugar phosphate isomerase/epimerase
MKSAVTICLVPEARSGPFVFHGGLADGCRRAAAHGFDAVEIFPPSAEEVDVAELRRLLAAHRLAVAAFGTGAGWLVRKLSLTSVDAATRIEARRFVTALVELAGSFAAPAIIGSMQGRVDAEHDREQALDLLRDALEELGELAALHHVPLLLEPLNRYETNLFNRLDQATAFLQTLSTRNVRLLADLFHMNIEEPDMAAAIRHAGELVGHVHFADSNRRAIGFGHTNVEPVIAALRETRYTGILSAEIFPLPSAEDAARQTMDSFRRFACG